MKTYLIAFEGVLPEASLINKVKSFHLWSQPLGNLLLVKTSSDRNALYNYLTQGLIIPGKILIIQVTDDWIAKNLSAEVIRWMQGGL